MQILRLPTRNRVLFCRWHRSEHTRDRSMWDRVWLALRYARTVHSTHHYNCTIDHCRRRQSFGRVDIASVRGCHPTSNQLSARHTPLPQPRSRSIAAKRLPTQRFAHGANRVTRMRGLVRCIRAACPVCAIVRVSGWPTAPQAGTGITSAIAVVRSHPSVSFRRGLGGDWKAVTVVIVPEFGS